MPPTVTVYGYDIDIDVLYRAMWDQAVEEQGVRVFKGNSRDVRSMKRLLNDLFDVPVQDRKDAVNAEARRLVTHELHRLGWARKVNARNEPVDQGPESRSGRYLLHRSL